MKSLITASAIAMAVAAAAPLAQDIRPTQPGNSPLAQNAPAQRDPGRASPLAAAAADTQTAGSAKIMSLVPGQSVTVTDWYKQGVYHPSSSKIGEIKDMLLAPDGKVNALIIGVGGFLGMGEKDVAVPFQAVKHATRDGKVYLTLDTTKDALKSAPGLKYDRDTTTWVPDNK